MKRRNAVIAMLAAATGIVFKSRVRAQEFRLGTTDVVSVASIEDGWKHWQVTCPETLTVVDRVAGDKVVLTRADIMAALREP